MKKDLGSHVQCQPHHVGVNVPALAGLPGPDQPLGGFDDGGRIGSDASPREGGLHQAALPEPEAAFARQQALAEEQRIDPQGEMLDKVLVLGN